MDGSHDNTLSAMLYQEASSGNRIESTSRSGEEAAAKTGNRRKYGCWSGRRASVSHSIPKM